MSELETTKIGGNETEPPVIDIENVTFTYADSPSPALNGVSLKVNRGEFLSVIGHNGSGKSTLARLFNGLLTAESGKVLICGTDAKECKDLSEIRKKVGVVFQNPDNQMVASIVEDDIAFGPENTGIDREEIGRRIDWALSAVGMESYRTATPARLSGGQKQRIAIAGVLAVKPEILVLDESTAMLDPKGRREVIDAVRKLNKEENITVILITHFMEEALLADRTVVLNRGEVALVGTPREIFKKADDLETFNLAMPEISTIAKRLNAAGMNVGDELDPVCLAENIAKSFKAAGIESYDSPAYMPQSKGLGGLWDIVIRDLYYTYSEKSPFSSKALKGVNLTVKQGEFFGILGHTGSGKSTLIQHLNALIKLPQAQKKYRPKKVKKGAAASIMPEIKVGAFDLADKKCDFKALRASVGVVFQYPEYQLFAETVFEDVAFGLKNFNKNVSDADAESAVRYSLTAVGLDYNEVKDKSPFDLSGGQKRRVAIAGVIVTKPEILVLDEPAAGLDPKGKREICELLHRLHGEWCKTVIIVSHDMDEIAENCSSCAVISDGRVFAQDCPARIFKRGDELRALGLDVPLTRKISEELEKRGYYIDSSLRSSDFSDAVIAAYKGGNDA